MKSKLNPAIYILEVRFRDHLRGRWGPWESDGTRYHAHYTTALQHYNRRTGHGHDARDSNYRIVTFTRGRIYHDKD